MSLNATLLREILTHKPLNAILVSVKYENRRNILVEKMQEHAYRIEKYSKNIVFMVSHCDQAKDLPNAIQEITSEMTNKKLDQQVVFYSNEKFSKAAFSRALYNICSNLPKVTVTIDEETFLMKFPVGNLKHLFEQQYKDTRDKVQVATRAYIEIALALPESSERPYIIQELALHLKLELKKLLEKFIEDNKDRMLENDYFGIYFGVQKTILDCTDKFRLDTEVLRTDKLMHELSNG